MAEKTHEKTTVPAHRAMDYGLLKRLAIACGVATLVGGLMTAFVASIAQAVVFTVTSLWIVTFLGLSAWIVKLFITDQNKTMGMLAIVLKLNTMFLMLAFMMRVYRMMEEGKIANPGPALLAGLTVPIIVLAVYAFSKLPASLDKSAGVRQEEVHG